MLASHSTWGWTLAALLAAGTAAQSADPADTQWLDVESRIQYGYYTEDRRALEEVAAALATDTSSTALRQYYLGLASYRLALLDQSHRPDDATQAAERCVSSLDDPSRVEAGAAEALALQAACWRTLARLNPVRSPFFGVKGGSAMRHALALAPGNPRVMLLDALADYDQQRDRSAVIAKLRKSVAAFERERAGVERPPSWGAPEAYASLGRSLLEQGDAIAARGALEHALLLVPDFAYAHRLMARITSG
ncbi:MAG TPA: hypothetical protein VMD03_07265 [Steroidobacteraceae bacterium]|nr:hypothetical protein [Steroidobacteraceae bacterium]